ncbi:MAG: SUMF1/EgtB/PvdO family nonheme iron enzyme [Akkermansiaceae bacterium]|nr:SUMF1/EgtB/PvdO family nonheme iron enzyme [Akkermansiaceae bacterium]
MKRNLPLSTCAIVAALITSGSATVTMDWVTIGDINNAADPLTGYGSVDHAYRIGKYEVTNAQYGEFLNAKGQSNANGIYHQFMSNYGITQTGSSGSYSYTVTSALANRPVVYVSWLGAARFANWMVNGQGNGNMENGAYTLNGATGGIILANAGAQVYIPSENEWYKAAYYNAANSSYSLYPNGQNTIATEDANYNSRASTDVGTYAGDPSFYGTFDQGGNVWEYNDAIIEIPEYPGYLLRGLRGGSSFHGEIGLAAYSRDRVSSGNEDRYNGFRLATVPEPTSIVLSMFAGGMMLIRRKR